MRPLWFVCIALCAASAAAQKPADCTVALGNDGTATVRGVVSRNDHGCSVDGACELIIACNGAEIFVSYTTGGDLPPNTPEYRKAVASGAVNAPHIRLAMETRAGEFVEVHGPASVRNGKVVALSIYYDGCWMKVISSEGAETISRDPPAGPSTGRAGEVLSFSMRNRSSAGHPLRYTMHWGPEGDAPLLRGQTSSQHAFSAPGVYHVTVDARCELDSVPVVTSEALTVTIQ